MLNKSEVKYIQSLSQKKFRNEERVYIIEGPKIIEEALLSKSLIVKKIYALEEWFATNEQSIPTIASETITLYELQKISQLKTPNQVLAVVEIPAADNFKFDNNNLGLMLDGIQDPGNLGTIIRIADWFGIKQIVCSNDTADAYNAKVVQATMGSIFRVELYYTELAQWMDTCTHLLYYGAALNGKPLSKISKLEKGIIVIGNESKGIRPTIMERLSGTITIEKWGQAESLNAAVATGIILSHLR